MTWIYSYYQNVYRICPAYFRWLPSDTIPLTHIICRIPFSEIKVSAVNTHWFNYILSLGKHTERLSSAIKERSNNALVTLWRYKEYMHRWMFLEQLKYNLPLCHQFLRSIDQIAAEWKKSIFLLQCARFICVIPRSKRVNADKIKFICKYSDRYTETYLD